MDQMLLELDGLDMDGIDENQLDGIQMFLFLYMLYNYYKLYKQYKKQKTRRFWVRPINRTRNIDGYFMTTFMRIKENDSELFFKHTRMNVALYNVLLSLISNKLTKKSIRTPIEAECRLAITLSYLSQGVSQQFLAWSFKMGRSTVHNIIEETCDVIWEILSEFYVCQPNIVDYKKIAHDFEHIWDIPNCLGAIDGKHISIQSPPKSGSLYYNYKNDFSIVLLAACDAKYCFTAVDIGAYGSQSDGGILSNSNFGKKLFGEKLPIPKEKNLPQTTTKFPYFFIGDPAFPLKKNLMKAYPGNNLSNAQRIYNYRISRARVVIENSFGILVARWRVLRNTLNCIPEKAEKIVLATIALHNFIKLNEETAHTYCPKLFVDWEDDKGNTHMGEWRREVGKDAAIENLIPSKYKKLGSNNSTKIAFNLREILKEYFTSEGAILRQNKVIK